LAREGRGRNWGEGKCREGRGKKGGKKGGGGERKGGAVSLSLLLIFTYAPHSEKRENGPKKKEVKKEGRKKGR